MNRPLSIPRILMRWTSRKSPEWDAWNWFNLGIGSFAFQVLIPGVISRQKPCWPYVAFCKEYAEHGLEFGFGLLQVGGRFLLGVVSTSEYFKVDALFLHLVLVKR